jgi:hypothetical protein
MSAQQTKRKKKISLIRPGDRRFDAGYMSFSNRHPGLFTQLLSFKKS